MSDVGVEVGQKMRLAIKAKLTELNCYVDDELPDYIMVMIANKRTKSQMKEDLSLFLANQTSFFVEWLHVVLKKLKQVHVTNPNVFKSPAKRKSNEFHISQEDYKRVKKEESKVKKEKPDMAKFQSAPASEDFEEEHMKSLTDDLPITASQLSEAGRRKIVLLEEPQKSSGDGLSQGLEDDFDIPLLSEINAFNEEELKLLEKRIKNVKSRLGLQIESDREDNEDDEHDRSNDDDGKDCLSIKPDPAEMEFSEQFSKSPPARRIITSQRRTNQFAHPATPPRVFEAAPTQLEKQLEMKRSIHARIVFDKEKDSLKAKYDSIMKRTISRQDRLDAAESKIISDNSDTRKRSILDRLGKRPERAETKAVRGELQSKVIKPRKERKEADKKVASAILSRVGVLSKVSIPQKKLSMHADRHSSDEEEHQTNPKNVLSVVKVKPRVLPAKTKQANPNLLFKAVAEAQRSVNQTPSVGKSKDAAKSAVEHTLDTRVQQEEKLSAPALFTKKYKEQMAAAKKCEELACLDAKRSIIMNKNKKAKLLDDEKQKLRLLLTQNSNKSETKRILKKVVDVDDEQLQLESSFNDDFVEFDETETHSNASDASNTSCRTPELTGKHLKDLEERQIFFKKKTTIERKAQHNEEANESDADDGSAEQNDENENSNQKFIVTLDGIDKLQFAHLDKVNAQQCAGNGIKYPEVAPKCDPAPAKKGAMNKTRRSPSPIIFGTPSSVAVTTLAKTLPATLIKKTDKPLLHKQINAISAHAAAAKKAKEKCKYFPNCRQGERCDFLHPSTCKMFPNCKFADQCIYAHPVCKFEMSCTRKNCPYSHGAIRTGGGAASMQSVCKYFPNCSNGSCMFYHPKMCKYGIRCKNAACIFQHPGGGRLTWRPIK